MPIQFTIKWEVSRTLSVPSRRAWSFHAVTPLRFLGGPAPHPQPFEFRLDTGAYASLLPERWLSGHRLAAHLPPLARDRQPLVTVAGTVFGRAAFRVPVVFDRDRHQNRYEFDFVVTDGLNDRAYGLLALRDLLRYFTLEQDGPIPVNEVGEPLDTRNVDLIPHHGRIRVRYRCPHPGAGGPCHSVMWGVPGLNVRCEDHGQLLVPIW